MYKTIIKKIEFTGSYKEILNEIKKSKMFHLNKIECVK